MGMDAGLTLADKRIFLVHYPHYARAMAATGDWDLVCCGHSHKIQIEHLPNIKGWHNRAGKPGDNRRSWQATRPPISWVTWRLWSSRRLKYPKH